MTHNYWVKVVPVLTGFALLGSACSIPSGQGGPPTQSGLCNVGTLSISPTVVQPGQTVRITNGTGRCHQGAYELELDIPGRIQYSLGQAQAQNDGTFSLTVHIPKTATAGQAYIQIKDSVVCPSGTSCAVYQAP